LTVTFSAALPARWLHGIGPHRLRHTAASEVLPVGSSLREVGKALRDRGSKVTSIHVDKRRAVASRMIIDRQRPKCST